MKIYYREKFTNNKMIVKEGDKIELGKHILFCIEASMVHWSEVIVIYDSFTGTLFSSDVFGKFGVNDINEPWEEEARRFYFWYIW